VAGQLLATGDAVNVAARLEQAAEPGEILIGAATLALARTAVVVEPLAPFELKGKGRPVQAYRLIAVEPGRPRPSCLGVPMVGRAVEKTRLDEMFRDVAARQACRLVTVSGTAGVGKSRLTAEFLTGLDARVVTGRCLSYGEGITYSPVVEVVKQLGDVGERLTAQSPQVAAAFSALMGEGSAATPGEIAWAVRRLYEPGDRPRSSRRARDRGGLGSRQGYERGRRRRVCPRNRRRANQATLTAPTTSKQPPSSRSRERGRGPLRRPEHDVRGDRSPDADRAGGVGAPVTARTGSHLSVCASRTTPRSFSPEDPHDG
jgi:AAA ATPase domain/Adenylate and Guanylate cyclase catalytic domain